MFEKSYSYYHCKELKAADDFAWEFARPAFYISQDDDKSLFQDPQIQAVFIRARDLAKTQNLMMPHTKDLIEVYFKFTYSYPVRACISQAFVENHVMSPEQQKEILVNFSKTLLIKNWLNRIKLYVLCLVMGMGNLSCFLLSLLILWAGMVFYYKDRDNLSLLIVMSSLLNFANLGLISIFEPPLPRYTYSTNLFFTVIVFISISLQLRDKEKINSME